MGVHASPARLKRELASVSPMPSHPQKRDIADFFKPYARGLTPTIPQKRSSPFPDHTDADTIVVNTRSVVPKTPAKTVSFKNVTPRQKSAIKQPGFSPASETSLPIRSPRLDRTPTVTSERQKAACRTSPSPKRSSESTPKPNVSFTFSDVSERSQHILDQDGVVVAVRDSDDDDTDSLESLGDLFSRRNKGVSNGGLGSPPVEDDSSTGVERIRALNTYAHGRSAPIIGKEKLRALHAKEKALKFDISKILNDHLKDEKTETNVREARWSDDEDEKKSGHLDDDKQLLASIVRNAGAEENADDVTRLLNAVERTEALTGEKTFRFFRSGKEVGSTEEMEKDSVRSTFPVGAIPNKLWQPGDVAGCARAYVSGFMTEQARYEKLSDEALRWSFQQVIKESDDELRQTYLQTLQAGSRHWTRLNLTAADVQRVFQLLGADPTVIRDNSSIQTRYQPLNSQPRHNPKFLLSALEMFNIVSPDMDMQSLSKLSSILIRLTLDTIVMSNGRLSSAVETLTSTLLDLPDLDTASHVYDRILSDATTHLQDPTLQAILLSRIPPLSPRANQLRKTLADVFLLGPSTIDPTTNTSSATTDDLIKLISTSPSFNTTRRSSTPFNYTTLTSQISLLDIAIGSGYPPPTSHPTSFNASIDNLADRLHTLFVSIKDTGASHMRRTEAKDSLQALYFRLLYSVRVGMRRKKQVFRFEGGKRVVATEEGDDGREKSGDFMRRFLDRKREIGMETGNVEVKGEDGVV